VRIEEKFISVSNQIGELEPAVSAYIPLRIDKLEIFKEAHITLFHPRSTGESR
jgi:hypothetical protein